jgi:hypothetical protein
MSRQVDIKTLGQALAAVPGLAFALLFGSARKGILPRVDSDIDVAVYLDHVPDFDERAAILGLVQSAVRSDRVDVVFLNLTESITLKREALYGALLVCHDPDRYASFFSLADRQGRDERDRLARAWALLRECRRSSVSEEAAGRRSSIAKTPYEP